MYDIFKDREDDLADKQFFFGKLPFEVSDVYDWNKHMELLNTHPDKLIDSNTNKFRIGLNCFHERPSAPDFARHIDIELDILDTSLSDTPYILCVAHTYPHKRVHLLIDAFFQLVDKIPHHLILVGRARRGEKRVQASLACSVASERIHRSYGLEYEQLRALYQNADVFAVA